MNLKLRYSVGIKGEIGELEGIKGLKEYELEFRPWLSWRLSVERIFITDGNEIIIRILIVLSNVY